jgi:hypothetical protein
MIITFSEITKDEYFSRGGWTIPIGLMCLDSSDLPVMPGDAPAQLPASHLLNLRTFSRISTGRRESEWNIAHGIASPSSGGCPVNGSSGRLASTPVETDRAT